MNGLSGADHPTFFSFLFISHAHSISIDNITACKKVPWSITTNMHVYLCS